MSSGGHYLRVGVDVDVPGPLHHTFQDSNQALQSLQSHGFLLVLSGPQLQSSSATGQLGQVIDEPLENICSR